MLKYVNMETRPLGKRIIGKVYYIHTLAYVLELINTCTDFKFGAIAVIYTKYATLRG
jgi:hypothetical protein